MFKANFRLVDSFDIEDGGKLIVSYNQDMANLELTAFPEDKSMGVSFTLTAEVAKDLAFKLEELTGERKKD